MKHTPTPWNYDITADNCFNIYCEGTIKTVAIVLFKDVSYMPNEKEAQANAEFIVKAVNSHEDLKDSLKMFIDIANNPDSYDLVWKLKAKEIAEKALKSCE